MVQTPHAPAKVGKGVGILRLRRSSALLHSGYAQDDRTWSLYAVEGLRSGWVILSSKATGAWRQT